MLDSVLRVCGREFDVDSFLKEYPFQTIDGAYNKGEMSLRKKPHEDSGFGALISDDVNSLKNISEIQSFIQNNEAAFSQLNKLGVHCEIDMGCTVGTSDQFTKSVTTPPALLGLLCEYGITLVFSAYPASDDNNET